jgi:hypothetical protein
MHTNKQKQEIKVTSQAPFKIKGTEYEATRCRDLAEECRFAKAKGQNEYLKGLTVLWGECSNALKEREDTLSIDIDNILKEKWWGNNLV